DDRFASVDGDRQALASAVGNLLHNAFKFTRQEGAIVLRTSTSADRVRIEVEDECGGLPSADLEGYFRPFGRRGSDRGGLGLGLSMSRRGVEASGGTLHVHDVPGKGCAFTVELPMVHQREQVTA
ncbi:MAG TPA: HAMP domain-containing sensor histidine kinase, partial [Thermoanaerobaculia bacterium]|nr:HAMP domain-containing sensor histidine kinase [Thermoanaerobaculia bacterium]